MYGDQSGMSCRKRWTWQFRDPKLRGSKPQTPLGWATFGTTTFPPRMRTPSKSHATPLHWASELKWSPFLSPKTLHLHHLYVVITYAGNFKGMY